MAALNFVAAEDGLEDDPKLRGLARLLKVDRGMAFWFVMRLRRFVLSVGDHISGTLPRKYTAEDLAAFLEFDGGASKLVATLKAQGYLAFKKGRGFFCPGWRETTTGQFAGRRQKDRDRHEEKRRERRALTDGASTGGLGQSVEVRGASADGGADGPRTSAENTTGRKQAIKTEISPPDPPPSGGASVADARWEWVLQHASTPQNRRASKGLLEKLSEEDWGLVQAAYLRLRPGGPSISKRDLRVLQWPTDQFLRKEAYLRFAPKKRPVRSPVSVSKVSSMEELAADLQTRLLAGDRFLLDQLSDPDGDMTRSCGST